MSTSEDTESVTRAGAADSQDEYEIVRYRPELKEAIAELQQGLWSPDPRLNRRYFEWKYEANPYIEEPVVYLACHRGEIVGMRGFYGSRWQVGSRDSLESVLVADDLFVRADHENRGAAKRIMSFALGDLASRGHAYLLNLSGSQVTVFVSLLMGWKSAGAMEPIGILSGRDFATRLADFVGRLPILWRYRNASFLHSIFRRQPFRDLDRALSCRPRELDRKVSLSPEARPEAMADLVTGLEYDGRIRHLRDRSFFEWRFKNPLSEYRHLFFDEGDGQLGGYLVLQRRAGVPTDDGTVRIADLEARTPEIASRILETAIRLGRFSALVTWSATLGDRTRGLLSAAGFRPVDAELTARGCPCILVRRLGNDPPAAEWSLGGRPLLDRSSWDMRVLYTMRG